MSYTLFDLRQRRARKPHRCIWCGEAIDPGAPYHDERSVYDGAIQRHRWHPECLAASKDILGDCEEFSPGEFKRGTCEER